MHKTSYSQSIFGSTIKNNDWSQIAVSQEYMAQTFREGLEFRLNVQKKMRQHQQKMQAEKNSRYFKAGNCVCDVVIQEASKRDKLEEKIKTQQIIRKKKKQIQNIKNSINLKKFNVQQAEIFKEANRNNRGLLFKDLEEYSVDSDSSDEEKAEFVNFEILDDQQIQKRNQEYGYRNSVNTNQLNKSELNFKPARWNEHYENIKRLKKNLKEQSQTICPERRHNMDFMKIMNKQALDTLSHNQGEYHEKSESIYQGKRKNSAEYREDKKIERILEIRRQVESQYNPTPPETQEQIERKFSPEIRKQIHKYDELNEQIEKRRKFVDRGMRRLNEYDDKINNIAKDENLVMDKDNQKIPLKNKCKIARQNDLQKSCSQFDQCIKLQSELDSKFDKQNQLECFWDRKQSMISNSEYTYESGSEKQSSQIKKKKQIKFEIPKPGSRVKTRTRMISLIQNDQRLSVRRQQSGLIIKKSGSDYLKRKTSLDFRNILVVDDDGQELHTTSGFRRQNMRKSLSKPSVRIFHGDHFNSKKRHGMNLRQKSQMVYECGEIQRELKSKSDLEISIKMANQFHNNQEIANDISVIKYVERPSNPENKRKSICTSKLYPAFDQKSTRHICSTKSSYYNNVIPLSSRLRVPQKKCKLHK